MFGGISLDGTAFGIAFTQVATTRMACPDMKTEQLFLSALGKVTGFYMIDNFHAALYQQPQTPIIIIEKVSIRKYKATITCPLKKEQDKKIILIKNKKRRRYQPAFFI